MGFAQYSQDYDETMPIGRSYTNSNPASGPIVSFADQPNWANCLAPYTAKFGGMYSNSAGKESIFVCPSDSNPRTQASRAKSSYAIPFNWNGSSARTYAYGNTVMPGRSIAEFEDVSGTLQVVEDHSPKAMLEANELFTLAPTNNGTNANTQDCAAYTGSDVWSGCARRMAPVHFDGWNYLFIDGHVKWLAPGADDWHGFFERSSWNVEHRSRRLTMKFVRFFFLAVGALAFALGGCGQKAETSSDNSVAVTQGDSLTQAQAEIRIKEVQNSKDIPESAKSGVIDSIRAKVR